MANHKRIWIFDADGPAAERVLQSATKVDIGYRYNYRYGTDNTLVFLSDRLLATSGMGGMVTIWDVEAGTRVEVFDWPEADGYPTALAHDPASDALAIGTGMGTVLLARRGSGQPPVKLAGNEGTVFGLQFGRDPQYLGAAGMGPELVIWDTQSLQVFARFPLSEPVVDMSRFEDGFLVAGRNLQVWSFTTVSDSPGNPSLDGKEAAIGAAVAAHVGLAMIVSMIPIIGPSIGYTLAMDAGTTGAGMLVPAPATASEAQCVRSVASTPDGLVVADMPSGPSFESIRVIETATGQVLHEIDPRGANGCSLTFSPDGSRLLIANQKGGHVYRLDSRETMDLDMRYAKPDALPPPR